jgi:hypothetical protein
MKVLSVIKEIIDVHVDTIVAGDSIICPDGYERTVCKKDIEYHGFCGTSVFGDSYSLGNKPVKLVNYRKVFSEN